jgi:hypothetical protein
LTNSFLVAYLKCGETSCGNVHVMTQPGPGSGFTVSRDTATTFVSTATPTIACSTATGIDRCTIGYKPGGVEARLAWQDGAPQPALNFEWVGVADFQATQSRLDAAPSIVWSKFDNAYFVSLLVADGADSVLRVRRKAAGANNWTDPVVVASAVHRGISPGTFAVPIVLTAPLIDQVDVYYLEYQ